MLWVYGILKYGADFCFEKSYLGGFAYYGYKNIILSRIESLRTNILFMNEQDGVLHIDGTVHPILYAMADEIYFRYRGKKYALNYVERYALTKVFGVSVYKRHSFCVNLPIDGLDHTMLNCVAVIGGESIVIDFSYESHFSRMSGQFEASYWCFGTEQRYMMVKDLRGLSIRKISKRDQRKQERKLALEMLCRCELRSWVFWAVRRVYFFMKPIMKRRPIWMYLDKIYKAGDSAE